MRRTFLDVVLAQFSRLGWRTSCKETRAISLPVPDNFLYEDSIALSSGC